MEGLAGEAVQTTQSWPDVGRGLQPPMRSLVWTQGTQMWPGAGPPTHTPCPRQETKEPPLKLSAMGEMEQLRQEAEQLKKQIAVTPEPSIPPGDMGKPGTECGSRGKGWLHPDQHLRDP